MRREQYRLSPEAQRDLLEIEAYVEQRAPGAADTIMDDIEAACALIGEHPEAGRVRDEIDREVRSFPVGSYVIFYYSQINPVGVARILHGKRDLGSAFRNP